MMTLILIFAVGIFYQVYQRYRNKNLPLYFDGYLPIVGHSLYVLVAKNYFTLLTETLNTALERNCDVVRIRLGIWDIYLTMSPEHSYFIANSCLQKDTIYDFMKAFFGDGLITASATTWATNRKLLNPTFNQQILDGYLLEFNNQTRDLLETVAVQAGRGPFNHTDHMLQTTLHIICTTAMGSNIDAEDKYTRNMFLEALQEFLQIFTDRIAKFWLHSDLIYKLSGRQKQMDVLSRKMNRLTQKILDKKRAQYQMNKNNMIDQKPGKYFKPFLEFLLELSEDGSLTDKEITDELNTFIAAGTDTMAITLSNALTCIGSYNAVQDRILVELQEVFEGSERNVDRKDLPRLKYLEAVIKETLRMYPPVPLIGRVLDKDIKIKGYCLPAGSKCYIAVYGVLRHWSWGRDAHQFRPERWLDGSLPDNMKGFAAFGLGKRSCIGYNYSIMGLKTILASFLRRYSIKSDVTKMVQEFSLTTNPISGHEISIEKRNHENFMT